MLQVTSLVTAYKATRLGLDVTFWLLRQIKSQKDQNNKEAPDTPRLLEEVLGDFLEAYYYKLDTLKEKGATDFEIYCRLSLFSAKLFPYLMLGTIEEVKHRKSKSLLKRNRK